MSLMRAGAPERLPAPFGADFAPIAPRTAGTMFCSEGRGEQGFKKGVGVYCHSEHVSLFRRLIERFLQQDAESRLP